MWWHVARRSFSVALLCSLMVCNVEAAEKKKKAKTPASPTTASTASQPAPAAAPVESPQDKAIKNWLEKLNGTSWALALRPSSVEQGTNQQDTVTFEGRRVVSELLTKEGYGGSNFTLTVQEDGTVVWETMQAKTGGDMVFWRGEIRGETMSGVLSKQPAQGSSLAFSFTGTTRTAQAVPAPAAQPAPTAASESTPTTP